MTYNQTLMTTLGKALGRNELYRLLIIKSDGSGNSSMLIFSNKMALAQELQRQINATIPWQTTPLYTILHNGEFQLIAGNVRMYAKSFAHGENVQLSE